ncbi:glycine--tRNA ligase subunit beta [Bowmanella yangjiangensis]|uniref:Glycine--tRNA ligase beta subunit n=1 Tax=Bowmanella yangjiangensis TaxID=2811230 RepID=A0ABS3CXI3_9ALTE|nr:glycine--tRNA ligase subunit beta [Bowmanella yangjiangensis]MBN7821837.1 glycine--tRNA ligase subunit beta [Bowmanella yangjiangensis]
MRQENLLIEIGTEELPPKALTKLAESFAQEMDKQLQQAELSKEDVTWFASPRRLAVYIKGLAYQQADKVIEKRGPAISAAFDADGQPTRAALGWAQGLGIDIKDAQRLSTDKGEWLLHMANVKGESLPTILADMVNQALKALPIPKPMRWGNKRTEFIRPVHNVCMMFGNELIDGEVLGIRSSTTLSGHRFHHPAPLTLDHADNYLALLRGAYVLADFRERKEVIRQGLAQAASSEGAAIEPEESLLEEVTALVEWPVVLTASFEESFLQVPKEALIYTMKGDQKYFPLFTQNGELLPRFAFVTNIESKDPVQIVKGNEKVIRPRLADAEFFFTTDKKQRLADRLASLDTVLFQKQLGTLKDKSERIASLAAKVAEALGANQQQAQRAGLLSKTDLMSNMVMEFPDVQGVMGMHYARLDGEDEEVALALNEQYMPRFSGDQLPSSNISCAVAIADKLDTLVGIFGIGQAPKGDKDPFALRRAAIGLLRIVVEKALPLDLQPLISASVTLFGDKLTNSDTAEQVFDFVQGRFRAWYQEQGVDVDVIQSVLARRPSRPADFDARIKAVQHFKTLEAAQALAAANKRVANILAKVEEPLQDKVDAALLKDASEQALLSQLESVKGQVQQSMQQLDYKQALVSLATLRECIDLFFDQVMVMDEDLAVRANRLALLSELRTLFLGVADISILN